MIFTYRYCRMLEENSFRGHTADFVVMFLFGSCSMVIFALFVNLLFLGKYKLILQSLLCSNGEKSNSSFVRNLVFKLIWFYLFRSSIYNNASLCLGATKSISKNEFLWPSYFSSSISSMGPSWILIATWKFSIR